MVQMHSLTCARGRARARHRGDQRRWHVHAHDGPIQYGAMVPPSGARQCAMINIGQTLKFHSGNSSLILLAVLACLPACLSAPGLAIVTHSLFWCAVREVATGLSYDPIRSGIGIL